MVLAFRFLFWDGGETLHPVVYYARFPLSFIYLFIYFCVIQLFQEEIPYIRTVEKPENHVFGIVILDNILIMWLVLYSRCKQLGVLACEHWANQYPKFNTPERKAALAKFAEQIAPECAVPAAGFNKDGIAKHIQDFFNEQ